MYKCARKENRKKIAALLVPAVFTLAMVGISEPIEYTFLFVAPALYWLVYAPLCGLCYVLAEVFEISINGTAFSIYACPPFFSCSMFLIRHASIFFELSLFSFLLYLLPLPRF